MKEYKLVVNGHDYVVAIEVTDGDRAKVKVNGTSYKVQMEPRKTKQVRSQVAAVPASHPVQSAATPVSANHSRPSIVSTGGKSVLSPLPGVVTAVNVKVGDTVAVGQTLLMLEAMKMENNIDSQFAGVVKSVEVSNGSSVMEGDVLVTIE